MSSDLDNKMDKDQLDRIERFEAAYNRIDQILRKKLSEDVKANFMGLVKNYAQKHPGWRFKDFLIFIGELRNALIHTKVNPYEYVAIPAYYLLKQLESCLASLDNPPKVIPTFQIKVITIRLNDSLAEVLHQINKNDFSQFPVYNESGIVGLLTENGITRWLATHMVNKFSVIDLEDVRVSEVLKQEEARKNYLFIPSKMHVEDALYKFKENGFLEAVLITAHGKDSEELLGIMTKWDVVNM
jgi:predicted transcriptional regulator